MKEPNRINAPARGKSEIYPSVTMEECVRFIRDVDALGAKFVPYENILAMMGIKSQYTKSFLYRISTAKQFGFIITNNQKVQITDAGKKILYPTTEEIKKECLIAAFKRPPLYKKLIERFSGKLLPSEELLSNILLTEYGIVRSVKDLAASCFLESVAFLGLLDTGVLCLDTQEPTALPKKEMFLVPEPDLPDVVKPGTAQAEGTDLGYTFTIPTLSQKVARFYIPAGITKKDVEFIQLYIEQMIPAFLENLKGELS